MLNRCLSTRGVVRLLAIGCVTWALTGVAAAREFSTIQDSKTLVVGTEGAYPPFNMFKDNKPAGFEIELVEAIAARWGVKVEWRAQSFDALLPALGQDRFDIAISSFGITPDRAKSVDFTDPYYCSGGVIVARKGGAKTSADLAGKVVAVEIGTTYYEAVRKVPGVLDVKTFPRDPDALQNLLSGRVDAWVTDRFVAMDLSKRSFGPSLQSGDMLFTEKIAMAVKKGNVSLAKALNEALAAEWADGSYAKLSNRYFGEDIRCH